MTWAPDQPGGSGVLARDGDLIITLTDHEQPNAYTVETTLRNFPRLPSFVVEWTFPVMKRRADLDPQKLSRVNGRKATRAPKDVLASLTKPLGTADWQREAEKAGIPHVVNGSSSKSRK